MFLSCAQPVLLFLACLWLLIVPLPRMLGSHMSLLQSGAWGPGNLYTAPTAGLAAFMVATTGGRVTSSAVFPDASGCSFHLPPLRGSCGFFCVFPLCSLSYWLATLISHRPRHSCSVGCLCSSQSAALLVGCVLVVKATTSEGGTFTWAEGLNCHHSAGCPSWVA